MNYSEMTIYRGMKCAIVTSCLTMAIKKLIKAIKNKILHYSKIVAMKQKLTNFSVMHFVIFLVNFLHEQRIYSKLVKC